MSLIKVTARKIEANRRNAAASTGPRTDDGKDRSSRNAVTHGCSGKRIHKPIRHEDPEHFDNVRDGLLRSWKPFDEQEEMLVSAITAAWIRVERSERWSSSVLTGIMETRQRKMKVAVEPTENDDLGCCIAMTDRHGSQMWDRVERHSTAAWRDFNRCVEQLRKLQTFRMRHKPANDAPGPLETAEVVAVSSSNSVSSADPQENCGPVNTAVPEYSPVEGEIESSIGTSKPKYRLDPTDMGLICNSAQNREDASLQPADATRDRLEDA